MGFDQNITRFANFASTSFGSSLTVFGIVKFTVSDGSDGDAASSGWADHSPWIDLGVCPVVARSTGGGNSFGAAFAVGGSDTSWGDSNSGGDKHKE